MEVHFRVDPSLSILFTSSWPREVRLGVWSFRLVFVGLLSASFVAMLDWSWRCSGFRTYLLSLGLLVFLAWASICLDPSITLPFSDSNCCSFMQRVFSMLKVLYGLLDRGGFGGRLCQSMVIL